MITNKLGINSPSKPAREIAKTPIGVAANGDTKIAKSRDISRKLQLIRLRGFIALSESVIKYD